MDRTEPGLERTILEAIKAARRLLAFHRWNPLLARAHKMVDRRLFQLEDELQRKRRKRLSQPRLHEIGREVASLVDYIVKSLIRYSLLRLPRLWQMPNLQAS